MRKHLKAVDEDHAWNHLREQRASLRQMGRDWAFMQDPHPLTIAAGYAAICTSWLLEPVAPGLPVRTRAWAIAVITLCTTTLFVAGGLIGWLIA